MICGACEANNPDDGRFCEACGRPVAAACRGCGAPRRPGARFCGGCGAEHPQADVPGAASGSAAGPGHPPGAVARHLLASRYAAEGERKLVTILFADVQGSTRLIQALDPELALQRLEPALDAMADAVRRCGGIVNQKLGDGVMALFGAPVAREDHAVRACRAAKLMLGAVARLGVPELNIRVGLNSGEVVVRTVGNDVSLDYHAVGPDAHLAHRLEQLAAPGAAYLTARTLRLAGGAVQARPLGALDIRGFGEAVEVHELASVADGPRWDLQVATKSLGRFVGRDAEMSLLAAAARRASAGHGQVVSLLGDAGMGKSRLVHEFCRSDQMRGWTKLRTSAASADSGTPFGAASGLVRDWIGAREGDDPAGTGERLRHAAAELAGAAPVDVPALRALLDLPGDDPSWQAADPQLRGQRMRQAVCAVVLRIAARRPTLLTLEDMHWVDGESAAALEAVVDAAGLARLLVVATGRPEWRRAWTGRSYCSLIRLEPLEPAAAHALLDGVLGGGSDLDALRERLVEQTEAVPLFLEEMARALVERGVVVGERVLFRLTRRPDEVEIPESVQALLAQRVDGLPPAERELLQVASVVGRRVPFALLRAVAELPDEDLSKRLAALLGREFLYEHHGTGAPEYSFKHALTHAATYEGMLVRHRRRLHAQALAAIEACYPGRLDEFTERLADHAFRAEAWPEAARYAVKAGWSANAVSAHAEAIPFFESALAALARLPDSPEHAASGIDAHLGLRVALAATADLRRVRTSLERAAELAERLGDRRQLANVRAGQCTILTLMGAPRGAAAAGEWARAAASELGDEGLKVAAGFALGQAYSYGGLLRQAASVIEEDLGLVRGPLRHRRAGTTGTLSVLCLAGLANTFSLSGDLSRAVGSAAEACAIAEETGRAYDLSYANAAHGHALLALGDVGGAVESLEKARRHCQDGRLRVLFPSVARFLGQAYVAGERGREACELLREAVAEARAKGLLAFEAWCGVWLGFGLLADGRAGEAAEVAPGVLAIARDGGLVPVEVQALRLAGDLAAHGGDDRLGEAADHYRAALALARRAGMLPDAAHCGLALGRALGRTGAVAEARRALTAARDLFHDLAAEPWAHRAEAELNAQPASAPPTAADPERGLRPATARSDGLTREERSKCPGMR